MEKGWIDVGYETVLITPSKIVSQIVSQLLAMVWTWNMIQGYPL